MGDQRRGDEATDEVVQVGKRNKKIDKDAVKERQRGDVK